MASRKAFLESLPCLQLPLSLVFRPLPMCLSHFPDSSSLMGGWDPPHGLVSVFSPFPQSLLNHPSSLLLIIVPLSPHPGLPHQPGAETFRWLLCTVIPFPRGEHGIEAAGPGAAREAEILIKENLDERTECSELCSPPRSHCPVCPGRASRVGEGSAVPVC